MASTYTTNSGIEKPGDGEQSGTWGDTVNTNMDIIDTLVSGFIQITAGSTSVTLTTTDGSVTAGMNKAIKYVDSGDLGGNCTVTIAPNDQEKLIFVENGLSASRSLIFSQGSGANFTLQAGKQAIIRSDGAGSGAAVSGVLANLEITTLEVTGAAALDGAATLGSTLTVTGASQFNSTITAGVDDTGYDVKFFGDTASRYWLWDTSADGVVQRGTLTVGVDDTGHDVKFFGATSGKYWLWDESADGVVQIGTLTVGVDDAGHDVKFFGATASRYLLWDESADSLLFPDNVKAVWGGVFEIFHDASNTYLTEVGDTTGNVYLRGNNLILLNNSNEVYLDCTTDGAVQLYYDATAVAKTSTTSWAPAADDGSSLGNASLNWSDLYLADGAVIYGGDDQDWTMTHITDNEMRVGDADKITFGAGGDLEIYHSGSHSYVNDAGTGNLYLGGDNLALTSAGTTESYLQAVKDGAVTLYYDNSAKIATTADGVSLSDASSIDLSTPLLSGGNNTETGLTAQMLAGGTISAFDLVCIHTTNSEVVEADASAYATARVIGIAPSAISDTATGTILLQGFIRNDSWSWTAGSPLYLSETAGAMTHTPPSTDGAFVQVVGVALNSDVAYINPSMDVIERA